MRRLQRWRTNVQKKHSRSSPEDQTDADVNKTFSSTVAEIFSFIVGDPDKAVSGYFMLQETLVKILPRPSIRNLPPK